jgi:hypothetical protein
MADMETSNEAPEGVIHQLLLDGNGVRAADLPMQRRSWST